MKVNLKNEYDETLTLPLATHDRAKGMRYAKLDPGSSMVLDENEFTDQVKKLIKKKALSKSACQEPSPARAPDPKPVELEAKKEKKKETKSEKKPDLTVATATLEKASDPSNQL